jgi:glycosyltransferase involved in cell wall biosynthesis
MATYVFDGRTMQDHYPGIGRYAYNLARALVDTFPEYRMRLLLDPRARNSRFNLLELSMRPNVETIPVRARIFSPQEQSLGRNPRLLFDARVWHSPYYALPLTLPIPPIVTIADLTPLVLPEEMPNPSKRTLYRFLNYTAARRSRSIITVSNASRFDLERLLQIPTDKIAVIPEAPDPAFVPASPTDIDNMRTMLNLPKVYALYVGTNKPHKNLLRLIEAWAYVGSEAVLVIAGVWDPRYPQPKQLVSQWSLQDRILFRHNIPENLLPILISGARAFVFPSLHEGFGLPPLEAMACGTPVVCSHASSLPEVVGDGGYVFDPLNVQDIADALTRVLGNANLRFQLRAKGLQQAEQFSWERAARETMLVYQRTGNFM